MTKLLTPTALALSLLLLGCTEPGHYPISGEECTATDPVLDVSDCTTVPGAPG